MSKAPNGHMKKQSRNLRVATVITVVVLSLFLLDPSRGFTIPHIIGLTLAVIAVLFWFGSFDICWIAKCPYCSHSFEVDKTKTRTEPLITCPKCEGVFKGKSTGLW